MPFPNADRAIIPEAKLREYLLNPRGRSPSQARLFAGLAYTAENWRLLDADIRSQHLTQDAREVQRNAFGRRWRIEADLRGPAGVARIRTTWIILNGTDVPRLTSAYRAKP